ncbi:MAG: molecular chaperone TorD family protein [Armatimonadetes bacterium]|nr:molecular chaperone TorD family protein [Armatimonadota bacterium]
MGEQIKALEARATVYHHISLAFLKPDAGLFRAPAKGSFLRALKKAFSHLTSDPSRKLPPLPEALFPDSPKSLEDEFRRLFGHTVSRDFPPYETEYGSSHVFQQTQSLADITGFYRAFGLEVSTEQRQRPDHISVELEFMHFLAMKEVHALRNNREGAGICEKAMRKFLDDHLLRWAPIFCDRLLAAHPDSFYGRMAEILKRFLVLESSLFP